MTRCSSRRWLIEAATVMLAVLAGCQDMEWGSRKDPGPEKPPEPRNARSTDPLIGGTIGEQTLIMGISNEPLRGFGLVIGLSGTGSGDCPTVIREYLMEFLGKQIPPQGATERRAHMSSADLIDSLDTAVVEVTGVVPSGSVRGTRFDLHVQAIPGTATRSLEGGLLLPTELRYFDPAASGAGLIAGAVLAEGGGPLFVNPFAEAGSLASEPNLRRGDVLGGGKAIEARPVKLTLLQPNYSLARAVERRLNERFGQRPPAASALSMGYVVLNTPPDFAAQPELFRRLVAHVLLDGHPAAVEQKLREYARAAAGPTVDYESLSLAWEAVGRGVIPHLRGLYTHADEGLRFYAARAGLRVGDNLALDVVAGTAAQATHSLRLLAIRELGRCSSPQAPLKLAPILNDADQEVRVAAFEALVRHGHPAIQVTRFPHLLDSSQLNFELDVVDSSGPPLIYVSCTRTPRIAVFGRQMPLMPPVFYMRGDDSLTLNSVDGADDVRLFARRGGRLSQEVVVPPRVVDVITAMADLPLRDDAGRLRGLGLTYSRVVQVVSELCRTEVIAGRLVLEKTSMTDLIGPEVAPERPEGERGADFEPPPSEPPPAHRGEDAPAPRPEGP